jgi:hypothetical protein
VQSAKPVVPPLLPPLVPPVEDPVDAPVVDVPGPGPGELHAATVVNSKNDAINQYLGRITSDASVLSPKFAHKSAEQKPGSDPQFWSR